MKRFLSFAFGLGLCSGVAARADETRPARVRSEVNVEVIDDARHVEDIISKIKAQPRSVTPEATRRDPPKRGEPAAARVERPPMPAAGTHEPGAKNEPPGERKNEHHPDHRSDRAAAERERHQPSRQRR